MSLIFEIAVLEFRNESSQEFLKLFCLYTNAEVSINTKRNKANVVNLLPIGESKLNYVGIHCMIRIVFFFLVKIKHWKNE